MRTLSLLGKGGYVWSIHRYGEQRNGNFIGIPTVCTFVEVNECETAVIVYDDIAAMSIKMDQAVSAAVRGKSIQDI